MADPSMSACADNTTWPAAELSDLTVATHVAQKMLAAYGDPKGYNIYDYAQAHGGLTEALRILLRALGAERDDENAQVTGSTVVADLRQPPRCPAAHPEDPDPCDGPIVVTILDTFNAGADGCEHHAARLLASLAGGRPVAKPDAPANVALRIFRQAHRTQPYPWRGEGQ